MEGKQSAESIVGICPDQAAHRNGLIFKRKTDTKLRKTA